MNERRTTASSASISRFPFRAATASIAALALAFSACRGDDDDDPPPAPQTAELSGTLGVGSAAGSGGDVIEHEPNDTPNQVQFLGEIGPGVSYTISGSITDDGSDPADGFRFEATTTVALHMELLAAEPPPVDLDVALFDVETGTLIQIFETTINPEVGDFVIETGGTQFDLVVQSFKGASAYQLTLASVPPTESPAAPPQPPVLAEVVSTRRPDVAALYLGAGHAMVDGRVVALESDEAVQSAEHARFLERAGLELVSRTADGTSIYRLTAAAQLRKGEPGAFQGSLEHATARAAWQLSRQEGVRAASPDYLVRPHTQPNDTHFPLQWHYPQMKLPLAWDVATGSADVIVAVIDTGHTAHPDLLPRIVGQYDFISDTQASNDGDGADPDATDPGDGYGPYPSSFHGTHVSGTIGARSNDAVGVAGVDWNCRLYSLRALGIGGGAISDISAAVLYAARLPNATGQLPAERADVVNMSLGSPSFSSVFQSACQDARNAGVTLIASAGNEPDDVPKYPAAFDSVIAVGSVRYDKQLAPYSTFGTWVDVVAPGGDLNVDQNGDGFPDGVLSTYTDEAGEFFYAFQQGTSMASPHVAGVAALLYGVDPGITPAEVLDILRSTAQDLGPTGPDSTFGHGLVDGYAALVAKSGPTQPNPILVVEPTTIDFGAFDTSVTISLSNAGAGLVEVQGATIAYTSGDGWLSATLVAAPGGASITYSGLVLGVDRTGLAPGNYSATATIHAIGLPDQVVTVHMSVGIGNQQSFTVYVLLVDGTTFETIEQAITDLATGYAWGMPDVDPASYLLVAGTDVDDDGFIGDEEEPLFGMWPSVVDPMLLVVDQGGSFPNLDFPVGQGEIGALGVPGFVGFRRLE